MLRTITLQIPEATFAAIEKQAQTRGKQPAELAEELLAQALNHSQVEHDPLDNFVGSIDSPVTDVAERHDYYVGQAVWKEMRRDPNIR
jgi:hypothetical protein